VIKSFCSSTKQYLVVIEDSAVDINFLNDIIDRLAYEYTFDICILNKDYDYFFNEYRKNEHFNLFYDIDLINMKSYIITKKTARKILEYYTDESVYKYVIPITIYNFLKNKLALEVITPISPLLTDNEYVIKSCFKKIAYSLQIKVTGSIGKRLFQIATAYSICKDLNQVLYLDVNESKEPYDYVYTYFTVNNTRITNKTTTMEWTELDKITFKPSLIQKCYNNNVYLEGSFHTEKYFSKYRNELKAIFQPTPHLMAYFSNVYGRLSDYAFIYISSYSHRSKKYNLLNSCYYNKAVEYMMARGVNKFLVFSSKVLDFLNDIDYILVDENKFTSIQLMALCGKGGICSNSMTAWWGGWLNDNSVIFPEVWFKNLKDTFDLYYDDCYVLKVN
jgi:hypothetical protein